MTMKPLFTTSRGAAALAAALLLSQALSVRADEVSIAITTDISGAPGSTITVFGNLTNNTTATQYFGNDAINLTAPDTVATASDDIILNGLLGNGPTSVAAGAMLTDVDLFSVQILAGSGTYSGNSFQLVGGTDAAGCVNGAVDCTTLLGTGNFALTVAPVPLPSTNWLLLSGVGALFGLTYRRRRAA